MEQAISALKAALTADISYPEQQEPMNIRAGNSTRNVNRYANSVIESSSAVMKFMWVRMNEYSSYGFNCQCKWMYILRKWKVEAVVATFYNPGSRKFTRYRFRNAFLLMLRVLYNLWYWTGPNNANTRKRSSDFGTIPWSTSSSLLNTVIYM